METLGYVASLIMGVVLGLIGGGGSILTVPILVYLFQVSAITATGYSLFIVGATALIGAAIYFRKGEINFKVGFIFALPSLIGVNISRGWIIPSIPNVIINTSRLTLTKEILIMSAFALLMMFASYSMIRQNKKIESGSLQSSQKPIRISAQGFTVGLIAGFVGAGGGFLIIPALVLFANLPMRIAVGTSLTVIAIQSLFGFVGDISRGANIDWILLTKIAAIAIIGIIAGSAVSHKIKEQKLKIAFGWFVLLMGTIIISQQLHQVLTR